MHDVRSLLESERPLVVAHRGGASLRPENTLAAFDHAVGVGADVIELDVRVTADDRLVVHHDDEIDRTTDGSGPVHEFTLDELREFDAGYHFGEAGTFPYRSIGLEVPTFETVLERYDVPLLCELKDDRIDVDRFVELLEAADRLESVIVGGFDDELLASVRSRAPVVTGLGMAESQELVSLEDPSTAVPPGEVLFPPVDLLDPSVVSIGRAADLAVVPWTVNDPERMRDVLELGVDGVITDDPVALSRLLD